MRSGKTLLSDDWERSFPLGSTKTSACAVQTCPQIQAIAHRAYIFTRNDLLGNSPRVRATSVGRIRVTSHDSPKLEIISFDEYSTSTP
mmetsp:Transcript_16714/g.22169  ORF Transcript_16714/g.22169 Transcript_16714/m.22169 type:complete len:88 (-) Transcript_16714:122-385(-)